MDNLLELLRIVSLTSLSDKWSWEFDSSGFFSLKSARRQIDFARLAVGNVPTRWNKYVLIKVKIVFFWVK